MSKYILLTGGTGKIGTTLAKELINDDFHLYITTRSLINGKAWIEKNLFPTNKIELVECNFYDQNSTSIILNQISNIISTIIHNARDIENLRLDSNRKISANQFQNELYLATTFPYLLTTSLIESDNNIKDVIFVASMYGNVAPSPRLYDNFHLQSAINYGTAKAAQIHLTKEMAVRFAELNIRVNCISYGGVEGRVSEEFKARYAQLSPLRRMLNESDLYPAIKMLLTNPNLLITGENIKIDGGWTLW